VGSAYVLAVAAGSWLHATPGVPLLDGFAPPEAYRWVSPPPSLAARNRPAQPQRFTISMGKHGSDPQVISTCDLQATVVLGSGAIPPRTGSSSVELVVTPLASASVGAAPAGRTVAGNVYRLSAQYEGNGTVSELRRRAPVTLAYPAAPTAAGHITHQVIWSIDGRGWKKLATNDNRQGQLVVAFIDGLGYVAVAVPTSAADGLLPSPSAPPSASGSSNGGLIVGIAASAVLVAVAVVLTVRRRRRHRGAHRRGG
jgi:hypothetical protein